jgi:hypothetical protein
MDDQHLSPLLLSFRFIKNDDTYLLLFIMWNNGQHASDMETWNSSGTGEGTALTT